MFDQWMIDEDMGHGVLVPLVIAWVMWRERARWLSLKPQPTTWGFLLLAGGAMFHRAAASRATATRLHMSRYVASGTLMPS